MKSGNYLSSRQFSASTFGVKELNFCVRNGNRWDLFAIITAMAIFTSFSACIYTHLIYLLQGRLTTTQQTFANFFTSAFHLFGLVKIIDFFNRKDFVYLSSSLILLRSSPRPISIGQLNTLLHLHTRPINLVVFQGSY